MIKLNAQDLVNFLVPKQEAAAPELNLFLSTFSLFGENEILKANIQNIFIRPDFTLNITQLSVKKEVELASPFPEHLIGFTFNISGNSKFIIPVDNSTRDFSKGHSTVFKTPPHTGFVQFLPQQNYTSISIHLSIHKFNEIIGDYAKELPANFADAIEGKTNHFMFDFPYNSQINILLQSILNDDLTGLSKQFFLESRVLEIIGIQLKEITKVENSIPIKTEEVEKLKECERILLENYNQPLSLLQLSKMVGLNDFKLKQGFKAIYGKPVFKYLQEFRLNKAFEELKDGEKQVSEVADLIGYKSIGSFSNAFYAQFGFRPSEIKSV